MITKFNKEEYSLASCLFPISKRIKKIYKFNILDTLCFQAITKKEKHKETIFEGIYDYNKMFPYCLVLLFCLIGIFSNDIYTSLIIPVSIFIIVKNRQREITDQIEVIGKLPDVKSAFYTTIQKIHSINNDNPGYETEYVQPLIVRYFSENKKQLKGKEIYNLYLELSSLLKEKEMKKEFNKLSFQKIINVDHQSTEDKDNIVLDFLSTPPSEDLEIHKAADEIFIKSKNKIIKKESINSKNNFSDIQGSDNLELKKDTINITDKDPKTSSNASNNENKKEKIIKNEIKEDSSETLDNSIPDLTEDIKKKKSTKDSDLISISGDLSSAIEKLNEKLDDGGGEFDLAHDDAEKQIKNKKNEKVEVSSFLDDDIDNIFNDDMQEGDEDEYEQWEDMSEDDIDDIIR